MQTVSFSSQIGNLEKLGLLQAAGIAAESLHKRFDRESADTDSEAVVKVLALSPACLALSRQFELAGITNHLDLEQMKDLWVPSEDAYVATIRVDDERMAVDADCRREARAFQSGERGVTVAEAIHLYVQYPHLLNRHCFDCHGTLYGGGLHLPIFYLWTGRPEVGEACPGVFCQAATMGGPTLRVLDPVPDEINWEG